MSHLPTYEDFFNFFGRANEKINLINYYKYIQNNLDEHSRYFWDGGPFLRRLFREVARKVFHKKLL